MTLEDARGWQRAVSRQHAGSGGEEQRERHSHQVHIRLASGIGFHQVTNTLIDRAVNLRHSVLSRVERR